EGILQINDRGSTIVHEREVSMSQSMPQQISMGQFTKAIAWVGFLAALGLSMFDCYTSFLGIKLVMGQNPQKPLTIWMPLIFAILALAFNGLSAFLFKMFKVEKFTKFTPRVCFIMWLFFVVYDVVSAGIGMLETYAHAPVTSWETGLAAVDHMSSIQLF